MATVEHQKHGGGTMLMRTDPFRQLDRFAEQVLGSQGTVSRPSVMPMDAWRDGDTFLN
jgi:HSP20 family protein